MDSDFTSIAMENASPTETEAPIVAGLVALLWH
jgi:hypothetical protein